MAQFHFVEDYEKYVADLVANFPMDEAMERAVGGSFHAFGNIEAELLKHCGLKDGMHLVDLGCGSGRLAIRLHQTMNIRYTGTDIVQTLLDYAKSKSPDYEFKLNHALTVPVESGSADMISAFSLFTHLLHAETYLYLQDSYRALRSGGRVVFSFLEFACGPHWAVFESTVETTRTSTSRHLNEFIERDAINAWAMHLGFDVINYIPGSQVFWEGQSLGQSAVILQKP